MFSLNEQQQEKLNAWVREQDAKVVKLQEHNSFTPTTLGLVVKVKNNITKEEINLTEYSEW